MTMSTPWSVVFCLDARGRSPVKEFVRGLSATEQASIFRVIELLQEFGTNLSGSHVKHVVGDLWEIRPGRARVFYFTYRARQFVLVHGYYKRTQKAPERDIETATRRMNDFLEREQT